MEYTSPKTFFSLIEQFLLCAYIVMAPIYRIISEYITIAGINIVAFLSIFIISFSIIRGARNYKNRQYHSFLIFFAFCITLVIHQGIDIGVLLQVLLFLSFLNINPNVEEKKVFISFYISSILAAAFSISFGLVSTSVSRTGAIVEGSVAVVTILIILFGKENFSYGLFYRFVKGIAIVACIVVAAFGMSRSRILVIFIIIFVKFLLRKNYGTLVYAILGGVIVFLFSFINSEVFNALLSGISSRFESGFSEEEYRLAEIKYGLDLFRSSPWSGVGWGIIPFWYQGPGMYMNHCMYVALLARGGVLFCVPFVFSLFNLIRRSIKIRKTDYLPLVGLFSFALLAYGNAGLFNYSTVSMIAVIVISLHRSFEELSENHAKTSSK